MTKEKKPPLVRAATAAKAFADLQTVTIDRDTGEPMVWDGESKWRRGNDHLRAQIHEWADENVRDETNVCGVRWCQETATNAADDVRVKRHDGIRFDDKPHLIAFSDYNFRTQVLDLKTGERRLAIADDRVEMLLGETPDERETPTWDKFLDDITCGRQDLKRYLLRLAGYTLCGDPREHIVILLKGTGANGKGVFLGVMRALIGQYAVDVVPDFFKASAAHRHTTELADLHRRRMIVQAEAADGQWLVQRVKMLAGGDETIRARRMREDQSDVKLMGVPWFAVNETPMLQGGHAMDRRIKVLPFDFTAKNPHVGLKEELRDEHRGILYQLLQEAVVYRREGLPAPPECVVKASRVFMDAAASSLDSWLAEQTEPGGCAPFSNLHENMKRWFEDGGFAKVPTKTALGRFLTDRGYAIEFQRRDGRRERVRRGLRLIQEENAPF